MSDHAANSPGFQRGQWAQGSTRWRAQPPGGSRPRSRARSRLPVSKQPTPHLVSVRVAGTELVFETGRIARQAHGAVLARCGDNVVLATVTAAATPKPGQDFFPLTVEYREKFAAAGRIPGGFGRREGRILDHETLCSRLIDRTIRSLFPDEYRN